MPRLSRLDSPGLLHHVIIRGIERWKILNDDQDRNNFIDRLSDLLPETKTPCYAWAFMSNHAHFLFRSGPSGISTLMRRLLTGYAVYYNRRHGQLFQNRYKSTICEEDAYFKELVRYIHLNPLRAKIVTDLKSLDKYGYCGHHAIMGKGNTQWQDVDYVLKWFGETAGEARKKYRAYVEKGVSMGRRPDLVGGGLIRSAGGWEALKKMRFSGQDRIKSDQRILGDGDFVKDVLSESKENFTRSYELKAKGFDFGKIFERVFFLLNLEKDYITGKGRQKDRSQARDLICYWCSVELSFPMADLARKFNITPAAVSCAVRRGESLAKENGYRLGS